jgi:hypothetical protein
VSRAGALRRPHHRVSLGVGNTGRFGGRCLLRVFLR